MKKILYLSIFLMSALMICCKPDPISNENDNTNNDNPSQEEPLVKKYLVREYRYGGDKPIFIIDWNDDFTRIEHITTDSGTYNQLEYDFEYYGEDSMRVSVYEPGSNIWRNDVYRFKDGKITQIDTYDDSVLKRTEYRTYNIDNKLISNIDSVHNCGTLFEWDGDNICKTIRYPDGHTTIYDDFGEHIHPYYTQPYWMRGYAGGAGYSYGYITKPFWKNFGTCSERGCYEYDTDGYVTCSYHITEEGEQVPHARYEYDY